MKHLFNTHTAALSLLSLAIFIALSPSLSGQFLNWDDGNHIVTNPFIYSFSIDNLLRIFNQTINGTYIPLTVLSHNIEYHIFGLSAFAIHLDNILLHIAITLTVYRLGLYIGLSWTAAFIASAFFGLHPMRVESIAWCTERKDVLYGLFYMLSLIYYWRYLDQPRLKNYSVSLIFALLSILAKPMAVSLPWILLLIDYLKQRRLDKTIILDKIPFAIIVLGFSAITVATLSPNPKMLFPDSIIIWIWCFAFHIYKFIWPYPLLPIYTPPEPASFYNPIYILSIAILVGMIISLIIFRKNRLWVFACLFYVGSTFFLYRFNFVNINIVADRFIYIPSLGFCFVIGHYMARWLLHQRTRIIGYTTIGGLLALMGFMSFAQSQIWQNDLVLWKWTSQHEPHNATAQKKGILHPSLLNKNTAPEKPQGHIIEEPNTADAYIQRAQYLVKNNNPAIALWDLNKAVRLSPTYAGAYNARSGLYQMLGKYQAALSDANQAIALEAQKGLHYLTKANVLLKMGDTDGALNLINKAIGLDSSLTAAFLKRGLYFRQQRQHEAAIADFSQAINLEKNLRDALYYRGLSFAAINKHAEAIGDFKDIISINPLDSDAYNELGVSYIKIQQWTRALEAFDHVIELELYSPKAYSNRALVHVQLGNFKDALEDYQMAIRLNHSPYRELISKGDLYMVTGEPYQAIADYSKAILINKNDTIARLKRAQVYFLLKNYPKALKDARKVLQLDPANAEAKKGEITILKALNQGK